MPNVEWNNIPFQIISPAGTLDLNPLIGITDPPGPGVDGPQWVLLPDGCQAGSAKRVARDNSPQKSGEVPHRKFKAGLVMQLKMLACTVLALDNTTGGGADMIPTCGSDLVDLFDDLLLALNSMENSDGRLIWTPTGHTTRLMNDARWLGSDGQAGGAFTSVVTTPENEVFTSAEFALLSPFPYAIDFGTPNVHFTSGAAQNINNTGNTQMWPVWHVFGPAAAFNIINNTTGMELVYNDILPGAVPIPGGQAIELDFFRETAYFGPTLGPWITSGAKPGINVLSSDFWPLVPGVNNVQISGANADLLWAPAYTG